MQLRASRGPAVVFAALVALVAPAVARADAVTQWNFNATTAILASDPTSHASTLSFAMVQGAVYDAVNAIDGGYQPYLVRPQANPWDSEDAAVATAAYRVLVAVVPPLRRSLWRTSRRSTPPRSLRFPLGPQRTAGSPPAKRRPLRCSPPARTTAAIPRRRSRSCSAPRPGVWRVSPPLTAPDPTPWVGNVKPFLVPNAEMLRTKGPNALTSKAYARDFNELKSVGSFSSTTRTADETNAAIFWQSNPLGLYGGVMRSLSARFGLTTAQNARLFAKVTLAGADGAIGCWNDKYYWNFWRPIDAIRLGATDGNPATEADPTWRPLFDPATPTTPPLATPNFPDHPSGHSCVSSAILNTMRALLRHRQDRVRHRELAVRGHARADPTLRQLLERARRGHQRARLGRHPLPHRRRAGREARQDRREVGARSTTSSRSTAATTTSRETTTDAATTLRLCRLLRRVRHRGRTRARSGLQERTGERATSVHGCL